MFRRRWLKILLAAPLVVGAFTVDHSLLLSDSGFSDSGFSDSGLQSSADFSWVGNAQAAGKGRKGGGASRGSKAGHAPARRRPAASKAGGGGKGRKPAAASKGPKRTAGSGKNLHHRRFSDPGSSPPPPSSNRSNSEMLTPVEPERAGPVPTLSQSLIPRSSLSHNVAQANTEDAELTAAERELGESLALVVTTGAPYEPWVVQLQNTGETAARISSDVRLLWFEATVPGKRTPIICELPGSLRPRSAYAEERVELQPRQELSFNIDPRFFCFESQDTSLLVPGTFLKPHYGWRTKTQKAWQHGTTKEIRLQQSAPFVATSAVNAGGLKELLGAGIALDDRYAAWSKTRISQEDRLPVAAESADVEGNEVAAPAAPPAAPLAQPTEPTTGLELLMVSAGDAASPNDIGVSVAVRNRGAEAQRVFLRADQLTFYVWGPDGQVTCAPPFAYRAPDAQGLTTLNPGKRISMSVRLGEFCPSGTFARPGFYYVSAALPVLDNHDDSGRPLTQSDAADAAAPTLLDASFSRPLRVRSGEVRFNYWDVAQALTPPNYGDEPADEEAEETPEAAPPPPPPAAGRSAL